MNSMLLPAMDGLLEAGLAVLAVFVPLGLAYLMIVLPQHSQEDRFAGDEAKPSSSSESPKTDAVNWIHEEKS
ncbi:hypothetical protein MIZ01_2120 [Sideroxyarcus emersonii]|uniref:Uncharacterized protein n=1 Tax=Sideroxyarcus emersonii TaxID=2764705 RepID=A0AAN1XB81_9PROT|nr:hypothetical protein [Sideroxyarcus emersonii]BCK88317.1 hypothetical protein MIZ01_2120 [Sideroxyarcus emersonii]